MRWGLLVVALVGVAEEDGGIPALDELKCSACCSIVAELERNLETEKPRMNVDLRNTLTTKGAGGKEIDWAVSEARIIEQLEQLCKGMHHYGVTVQDDGTASFQRHSVGGGSVHISGTMKIGTKKYHQDRQELTVYCDALVEEHEDLLGEAVKKAGLAAAAKRDQEVRTAAARRRGDEPEADDPHLVLGVDPSASPTELRAAYRALSRALHPDKTGGDPDSLKRFVAVAAAYETLSGEKHQPYEDLYRQICVDIVAVCKDEAEVDYVKGYFPKYYNSDRFLRPDDDPTNKLTDGAPAKPLKKKKKKKKKTTPGDL